MSFPNQLTSRAQNPDVSPDDDADWSIPPGNPPATAVPAAGDVSCSPELFRMLFENASDAVLLIEDGVFSNCNRAALTLLGIRSSGELGEQRLWHFSPPFQPDGTPSEAKAKALFAEALRSGSVRTEWLFQHPNGTLIPLEVVLTAIRVTGKHVLHSVWRDITERKKSERELTLYRDHLQRLVDERTAELDLARQRVEAVLNNSVDGIVLADADTGIVQSNFAFNSLFACAPDDYFGMPLVALAYPDDAKRLADVIDDVITQQAGRRLEIRALRKDGVVVDTEFGIGFIKVATASGDRLVCSIRDITERKRAEKALSRSEERYRSVVDNIKEVIFQTDAQGLWTFLNPAWSEMTDFSVTESLGQQYLGYVHPDDREGSEWLFGALIRRERSYCRNELRFLTKEGGYHWIEVFARLTLDDQNQIVGTSGTLMDITERKHAEQALLQALEREKELGELKSRFVSMVSHEFRTPLATIQATTDTLRYYLPKLDAAQLDARFNKVQAQVKHMTMLLEDVLTFGWFQSNRVEFNPVAVNIDELCRDIIDDMHSLDKIHQLVYTSTDESLTADADLKLLRQVITNLLTNAIKYSPNGKSVHFDVYRSGDSVTFKVADLGIGIPEADQPHLFEAFFRASNVGHISGTGLGLAVAKHAVELHGGNITLDSIVGIGTTFVVTIPMSQLER